MFQSTSTLTAVLLAIVLSSCGDSRLATEGPPPVKPSLRVTAPPFQYFSVAAKHYNITKDSTSATTQTRTFFLKPEDDGSIDIPLEDGYDGLSIELITTTDEPVTVELFLDGKLHERVQSTSVGRLRVVAGNTTEEEDLAIEVRLDPEETKQVETILSGMTEADGSLEKMISIDPEFAQVDALLLTEMMRIASQRFGGKIKDRHTDRWSKVEADDRGTWNYRLPLEFTDGTIFFIDLIVNAEQLVAVRLKHEEFEKDWWLEAAYGDAYVNRSRELITYVIGKKYSEAYAMFGPILKEKLSVEQVQKFREGYSDLPTDGIKEINLLDERETRVRDEVANGATQEFLVTFEDGSPELLVSVYSEYATGRTWKVSEVIGFEFELKK